MTLLRRSAPLMPLRALDDAGAAPRGPCVLTVPGEAVTLVPLALPAGLRPAARLRVARAQLESVLGGDLSGLEWRLMPDGGALVADAALAGAWRAAADRMSGPVHAILPDYLALASLPEGWRLRVDAGADGSVPRVVARLSPSDGFAAPLGFAMRNLAAALRTNPPRRVAVVGDMPAPLAAMLAEATVQIAQEDPVDRVAAPDPALSFLRDPEADLGAMRRRVARWSGPLALMAAGIAAAALAFWIDAQRVRDAVAAREAAAREVARAAFLPSGPILDLRQQVARVIAARQSEDGVGPAERDPLALLHRASGALADGPARVVSLRGQDAVMLTAEITVPDFATLETVVDGLRGAGLLPRVARSSAEGTEGVRAVVEIAQAGAP